MKTDMDTEELLTGKRMSFWFYLPFILAAVLIGMFWALMPGSEREAVTVQSEAVVRPRNIARRDVTLYFPTTSGESWRQELQTINGFDSEREEIEKTLTLLFTEMNKRHRKLFPQDMRVDGVFSDNNGLVIVNFGTHSEFPNVGGIRAEMASIESVLNTIQGNFPSVKAVRFLVNGRETETFCGHLDISRPFLLKGDRNAS